MNELGYEFEEGFVNEDFNDEILSDNQIEDDDKKEIPVTVKLLGVLLAGLLIGYGYAYYEHTLNDADYMVSMNDCSSKINALQFQLSDCKQTKDAELLMRKTEINLTAMCWSDLELANYEISVLKGYNFTKPALIKQLDKDKEEFKGLSERYLELEKKLGI